MARVQAASGRPGWGFNAGGQGRCTARSGKGNRGKGGRMGADLIGWSSCTFVFRSFVLLPSHPVAMSSSGEGRIRKRHANRRMPRRLVFFGDSRDVALYRRKEALQV